MEIPARSPGLRLASIDAYRGFVMFLMMAEVLRLSAVADATGSRFWKFLAYHQTHVEWVGCSLHDLIQSSFSFLVGVALPFSIAARRAKGQSGGVMTMHAVWRALVLIALGIFLRSTESSRTNFIFTDTLAQIGLGYPLLFLLGFRPSRDLWIALGVILVGYWAAFALYPLPSNAFDYAKVGVSAQWLQQHALHGFAAHWNRNSHAAWAFDVWFMNLFPRDKPFTNTNFGSATLSFIPTLGTMILGLLAGRVLRSTRSAWERVRWLVIAGALTLAFGWLLGWLGICPVVKRIWTPSWTLFSGGWCFLLLAGFYLLLDVWRERAWAFPLVVIGMNSIAAYCIAHLSVGFIRSSLHTHLGPGPFRIFGTAYEPAVFGACVLLVEWLALFWMYRKRLFLRV